MNWEDIKGNVTFIVFGIIAVLFLFGLKDEPKNAFSGIYKGGMYIFLVAGIWGLISLLYKILRYLF